MKNLLILFAASLIIPASAPAQEEIAIQFLSFPRSEDLSSIEMVVGRGETLEIYIPGHELSQVYRVPALSRIVVGQTVTDDGGEKSFQIYGQAQSIEAKQQIILLVRKGAENSDGFEVFPIDGERTGFSGGSFMFFNASNIAVGGTVGDQELALRPGQRRLLKPNAMHAGGGCQVTLSYQYQEEWRKFYDTRWTVNPRIRAMVFFFQDPESGQLGVSPIVDILAR